MLNKMKDIFEDDRAVSTVLEFVFTTGVAISLFVLILLYSTGMFIEAPGRTVALERFTDIGNDISTKIVDIYIIAPENGILITDLTMPTSVGGHDYVVDAEAHVDQMVEVSSIKDSGLNVSVTINGITQSVGVNGSTHSGSTEHRLSFDSSR
ncbi:MAG: hypothetical protein SVK08_07830 [Halobacteriota archaeon]|nr:hypothetical protein [Halobacteriota archaeon]